MRELLSEIPFFKGERVTLRALTPDDADSLREFTACEEVYRYLPSFLFEKKYDSAEEVINRLYDECLEQSLILGVFVDGSFCGLAEIYGCSASRLKVSVGYRLLPRYWGQGISSEALGLMVKYLFDETEVRVITASVMPENKGSAAVLKKNGFKRVVRAVAEDWGLEKPVLADKWLRTRVGYRARYRFSSNH